MVQAAHDFRGTYNVRDYRWFNLRDSQTGHPGVFQNSGLLEDDYDEGRLTRLRRRYLVCAARSGGGRR